jgi:hypothetical protein
MPNIERLIVATSPFQELVMTTRRVYRWEDRMETTKYLLIYVILWYLSLILPGMVSFTPFAVFIHCSRLIIDTALCCSILGN